MFNIKKILLSVIFFVLPIFIVAEEIVVGTINRPPMAMIKKDSSINEVSAKYSGLSLDIMEEISERTNIDYKYKVFDKFGDMIDASKNGSIDMATANITITSEREKTSDFSQPTYDSGLQIVVSEKYSKPDYFDIILKSGILKMLGFVLLVLLIMAHLLWFFERGKESARHDYFRDDYLGGVWDAFWWAFIIITMGGFENEVPTSKFSRFLAMFWIVVSLFFVSTLTAKIASSMTISGLNSSISSVDDLPGKKVGAMESDAIKKYLLSANVRPKTYTEYESMYSDLRSGKLDAVVGDAPIVQYYVNTKASKDFLLVGEVFKPEKYGMIFPQGSELKEKFDRALIEMYEDGTYEKIHQKYFGK